MKGIIVIVLFSITLFCRGQLQTTTFAALDSLQKAAPKPVYVFLHTHWCNVCLLMEETTLKKEAVVQLLNESFYVVFFDAESKETIEFDGKTYHNSTHKTHELTTHLANSPAVYPTSCILDVNNKIVFKKEGLLNKVALLELLNTVLNH